MRPRVVYMGSTCILARTAISTNSILSLNVLRMLGSRDKAGHKLILTQPDANRPNFLDQSMTVLFQ